MDVAADPRFSTPNPQPLVGDLRTFLQAQLPAYMVPSAFVLLDALPLTPNGKVDRRALPAPEASCRESDVMYAAPQTALEQTIASVWQELLHVDVVGLHDNFFDLGGHSLLIAQVHNKLHGVSTGDISMVDLFRYPTISALAGYLGRERGVQLDMPREDDMEERLREGRSRLRQLRHRQLE
jgi:hypothetical protein